MAWFRLEDYVADVLLRDLVGHDHSPAAFVVYLFLWRRTVGVRNKKVRLSHRDIAQETGLSKSAVQQALRVLHRRGLVSSERRHQTDTPEHEVQRPWMRRGKGETRQSKFEDRPGAVAPSTEKVAPGTRK
jgi:transcription initiation factor IIE alpha subunit